MPKVLRVDSPDRFSFSHTISGHGWSDLEPFRINAEDNSLTYVFDIGGSGVEATIADAGDSLEISLSRAVRNDAAITNAIRRMLRLDEPFDAFYSLAENDTDLRWASKAKAGRLLRSPTVWEDLVKTMCTTNCSWALTRKMVSNLVTALGVRSKNGSYAFPTPEAMAGVNASFYRDEMRAGYRADYFAILSDAVASKRIDPERWLISDLPTAELRNEIKSIKGIGDYAADNLLKLLGRYDGLALDSWLRAQFYKKRNNGKLCADTKIKKYYSKYGEWQGLAIWCDMTEDWFQ